MDAGTYGTAIKIIKEEAPRDFVLYNRTIQSTMQHLFQPEYKHKYTEFTREKIPDEAFKQSIVIMGKSGVGKTHYALSHFEKPLIVSHIDDLKKLNTDNDGIVFDDINFSHWPAQSCIHLVDQELPRSINVKYGTVTIPANTKKIFTTNKETFNEVFSSNITEEETNAICRRILCMTVNNKIY